MSWIEKGKQHFDYDQFRSRLKNAIRVEGIDWPELCRRANVDAVSGLKVIEACRSDFVTHLPTLEKLVTPIGRSVEWLITGNGSDESSLVGVRERTHSLVDQFAYKNQLPDDEVIQLHKYVDFKLDSLLAKTPQAAYRSGIPESLVDMGWLYKEMRELEG